MKNDARQCFTFYPIEENSDHKVNSLDEFKNNWDLFITAVLIFSSFVIPYRVAFIAAEDETKGWVIVNAMIDLSFAFDIFIIFNTAFYDENFKIVESRKEIAIKYMKGWFFIDTFAIIPFDIILGSSANFNQMVKITRLGRMYKLIKLTRLTRIAKFVKNGSKLGEYIREFLKISNGLERIFLFVFGFLLLCHIICCLWAIGAQLEADVSETWLGSLDENDSQYLTSFYFTVTTITTVGYGDISGSTKSEKVFCILIMVIGVIAFSIASGSLASIITSYDTKNA